MLIREAAGRSWAKLRRHEIPLLPNPRDFRHWLQELERAVGIDAAR
jgi:hypothetical protein